METLPKHIVNKIGAYLNTRDRSNCELTAKVFNSIHENITYHEIEANSNINQKLDILFKKMIRLTNLVIHYRNNSNVIMIDSRLIPARCM